MPCLTEPLLIAHTPTGSKPAPKPMANPGRPSSPGAFSNPSRGTGYRIGGDAPGGGEPSYQDGGLCLRTRSGVRKDARKLTFVNAKEQEAHSLKRNLWSSGTL